MELLLPDESPEQALVRIGRRQLASSNPRAVCSGPTAELLPIGDAEFTALVSDPLYIGFFNLSGQLPWPEDFDGLDKTDEEWWSLYGLKRPRRDTLLGDGHVLRVENQLAVVPFTVHAGRDGSRVLRCELRFEHTAWVTHFAIGSPKHGILMAAQFNKPVATRPGNGFSLGIRLDELRAALPGPSAMKEIHE